MNTVVSLQFFGPLDPSASCARIRSQRVYEGCNASGGIQPSVYTGFNALAENLVTFRPSHSLTKIPCFDILNRVKRNGAVQDCMQVKTVIWYRVVCG